MSCLTADEIYLYVEGELSESDKTGIDTHLAECPACRNAAEERRRLNFAADALPRWDVPAGFAQQIMSRLFPQRLSLGRAFLAAAIGTAVIVSSLLLVFLLSGLSLVSFLMSLNQSILGGLRDAALYGAKMIKLLMLLTKALSQVAGVIWDSMAHLSGLASPQLQAVICATAVLITVSLYFGIRRLVPAGEKS